jgi:ribosomal protein L37E
MPRRNGNKSFNVRKNTGNHQRRRTTRGYRQMSKFVKYKWYEKIDARGQPYLELRKEGE